MRRGLSRFQITVLAALAGLFGFYNNFSSSSQAEADSAIPGRLLIQPKPGVSDDDFEKLISAHGGRTVEKNEDINLHVVQLPAQASEKAVLAHHPQLKFA